MSKTKRQWMRLAGLTDKEISEILDEEKEYRRTLCACGKPAEYRDGSRHLCKGCAEKAAPHCSVCKKPLLNQMHYIVKKEIFCIDCFGG